MGLSSWLAEQEVRGFIPGLANWISEIGYLLLPSPDMAEIPLKGRKSWIQPTDNFRRVCNMPTLKLSKKYTLLLISIKSRFYSENRMWWKNNTPSIRNDRQNFPTQKIAYLQYTIRVPELHPLYFIAMSTPSHCLLYHSIASSDTSQGSTHITVWQYIVNRLAAVLQIQKIIQH